MAEFPRVPTGNNKQYTLDAQAGAGANSVTLNESVAGVVRAPGYFVVERIDTSGNLSPTKREYKKFTGVSGAQLTGVTSVDGTDQVHAVGSIVEFVPDVKYEGDWYDAITTEHSNLGQHASLPSLTFVKTNNLSVTSTATTQLIDTQQLISRNLLSASGASITGIYPSGASGLFLQSLGAGVAPVYATPALSINRFQSTITALVSIGNTSFANFHVMALPAAFGSPALGRIDWSASMSSSGSITNDWILTVNDFQVLANTWVWTADESGGFYQQRNFSVMATLASGATIALKTKVNSGSVNTRDGDTNVLLAEK